METKASKIKFLRKMHGYTEADMAEKLCISQSAYSRIEAEKTRLDVDRKNQLLSIFKIDEETFDNIEPSAFVNMCNNHVEKGAVAVANNLGSIATSSDTALEIALIKELLKNQEALMITLHQYLSKDAV